MPLDELKKKLEDLMRHYQEEYQNSLDHDWMMLAYDFNSRYIAIKHLYESIFGKKS